MNSEPVKFSAADFVALLCAIAIAVAFLIMPWVNLMGAGVTGLRLLSESSAVIPGDISRLWFVPFAVVLGGLAAFWGLLDVSARRRTGILACLAGIAGLIYYGFFVVDNSRSEIDLTGVLGVGFWVALFACIGLIVQIFIPRATSPEEAISVLPVRRIVMTGMLAAISILLGATRIGFIPVPNISGDATIMHVPVILGAILEGPVVGTLVGAIFGVSSMLQGGGTMFADPLVSVLPRLFIGVAAYYSYVALRGSNEYTAIVVSSIVGTLTNTVLVVGMLVVRGYIPAAVIPTIIPQAIAEVIIAVIVTVAVVTAWKNIDGGRGGSSI